MKIGIAPFFLASALFSLKMRYIGLSHPTSMIFSYSLRSFAPGTSLGASELL